MHNTSVGGLTTLAGGQAGQPTFPSSHAVPSPLPHPVSDLSFHFGPPRHNASLGFHCCLPASMRLSPYLWIPPKYNSLLTTFLLHKTISLQLPNHTFEFLRLRHITLLEIWYCCTSFKSIVFCLSTQPTTAPKSTALLMLQSNLNSSAKSLIFLLELPGSFFRLPSCFRLFVYFSLFRPH